MHFGYHTSTAVRFTYKKSDRIRIGLSVELRAQLLRSSVLPFQWCQSLYLGYPLYVLARSSNFLTQARNERTFEQRIHTLCTRLFVEYSIVGTCPTSQNAKQPRFDGPGILNPNCLINIIDAYEFLSTYLVSTTTQHASGLIGVVAACRKTKLLTAD
jgi:hypothetical protein